MGKKFTELNPTLLEFINAQHMFFVATAPLSPTGHVNMSPKGLDSLAILGNKQIAYLDIGGSGIETYAHAKENGRITLMFCAYEGKAKILRLFGTAKAYAFNTKKFKELRPHFTLPGNTRAIMIVDIHRIEDSCGWGVPLYDYQGQREQLTRFANHFGQDEWEKKIYENNSTSIDGLPGIIR